MAHNYYQPSEYEEMMIAAGWLTLADLDDDYREYCGALGMDAVAYETWVSMKKEWDEYNQRYKVEIQPYYTGDKHDQPMPTEVKSEEQHLLKSMGWLELALGY
jgi:hypothetical protein